MAKSRYVRDFKFDPKLERWCTDRQLEVLKTWHKSSTMKAAGKELGIRPSAIYKALRAVLKKAAQDGYAPEAGYNYPVPEGLTLRGVSQHLDQDGQLLSQWVKSKQAGLDPDDEKVVKLDPDLRTVKKVSTFTDSQGNVIGQWVGEVPKEKVRAQAWDKFFEAAGKGLPRFKPVYSKVKADSQRLAVYPVGDHHMGMMAWGKETDGEDYDLSIAADLLRGALVDLTARTPDTEKALLVFSGDFLHYDGQQSKTEASGHLLDTDTRFEKMADMAYTMITFCIDALLHKHKELHVIFEPGNHDPSQLPAMALAFYRIYADEPRVTIDRKPGKMHYFHWRNVLIATHHGDTIKPDKLPGLLAHNQRELWGQTEHHIIFIGHVHHKAIYSHPGCRVESLEVLPPADAWHASRGYGAGGRSMQCIVYDDDGEESRVITNPRRIRKVLGNDT